jgi:hypothetical protein
VTAQQLTGEQVVTCEGTGEPIDSQMARAQAGEVRVGDFVSSRSVGGMVAGWVQRIGTIPFGTQQLPAYMIATRCGEDTYRLQPLLADDARILGFG